MIKNDGFKYPELTEKDYILGASRSAPFASVNTDGDWTSVLPDFEIQHNDKGDTNGCTNFGTTSQIEILLDYLFQFKDNFSERFQAVMSEQSKDGNDPQKVYESIRGSGMLTEELLPYLDGMTFDEYLSPIPMKPEYLKEAKKFINEYEFNHEYIYNPYSGLSHSDKRTLLVQALRRSPVGVSVYAWVPEGDMYRKPEDVKDNHWCVLVGAKEGEYWLVFDSYVPHIKKLAWNDPWFDVAKGIYIAKKKNKPSLVGRLLEIIKKLFNL